MIAQIVAVTGEIGVREMVDWEVTETEGLRMATTLTEENEMGTGTTIKGTTTGTAADMIETRTAGGKAGTTARGSATATSPLGTPVRPRSMERWRGVAVAVRGTWEVAVEVEPLTEVDVVMVVVGVLEGDAGRTGDSLPEDKVSVCVRNI